MRWLVLAGMLAMAQTAHAEAALDRIKAQGVLRIGTTGDYKPFTFHNPDGSYVGADIDMARKLATQLGVKVEFVPTVWAQLNADFEADKFDIAMGGVTNLPPRLVKGPFAHTVYVDGKRPITACANAGRFTSVEAIDKPEVRVVVNPGASNEEFARKNFPHAKLTVHQDNATVFDEIAAGREDVMVTDGIEVDHQSAIHKGVLCPAQVAAPFTRLEKAYWVRPDKELLAAVNGFVDAEMNSGDWKAILDHHLAAP